MYRGIQSLGMFQALHFTPWQTCSCQRHFDFSGKHSATLQLVRDDYAFRYPSLSVARYSFIHLSELWQCVKNEIEKIRTSSKIIRTRVLSIESPTF